MILSDPLPKVHDSRALILLDRIDEKRFLPNQKFNCCQSPTPRITASPPTKIMSEKTIEEKVKDIIVEQLGVTPEQVTATASFIEDLGADSLDTVELVMAFEEEFNVEVPDEDAEKLQTVGDVTKYIEEKSGK